MMAFALDYLLPIVTAVSWTAVYVLVIRRNYIEKTYGIPLVVLGINVALELMFSFVIRPAVMDETAWLWVGINVTWLVLDAIILGQAIVYGVRETWPSRRFFYASLAAALVLGFAGALALTIEFRDLEGRWSSFIDNLLMSILFIHMLYQRGTRGQSIYIAILKLVGTSAIGIGYLGSDPGSPLQWFLSVSILTFDLIYLILLYRALQAAGTNPWRKL